MTSRVVNKQLLGQEDIFYGEGNEAQSRNGGSYTINGVRNIQPVNSIAERDALDVTKFLKCRVYSAGGAPVDYEYTGGSWVLLGSAIVLSITVVTASTYTILATDLGKLITFDNALPITVTVPAGLGIGFHCECVQIGAGQVTFVASGTTLNSADAELKTRTQYSATALQAYVADTFLLAGDTSA